MTREILLPVYLAASARFGDLHWANEHALGGVHYGGGREVRVFLQHVGQANLQHVNDTVTNKWDVDELLERLPVSTPERAFFASNPQFKQAFSDGKFNCWACPTRAEKRFHETNIGDLVLIVPSLGDHDSGVHYLGIVKAKCPIRAYDASKIFWPRSDEPNRLYLFIFFFDSERGFRGWFEFLEDIGYDKKYDPRGHYRGIAETRFAKWGGPEGYLRFLRTECRFEAMSPRPQTEPAAGTTLQPQAIQTERSEIKSTRVVSEALDEPEQETSPVAADLAEPPQPALSKVEVTRIIRDNLLTRRLKILHEHCCQICGNFIQLPNGSKYSEAHHIKPLGGEHKGADVAENILILCPNHHAECDLGAVRLDTAKIRFHPQHRVRAEYIEYHNTHIYDSRRSITSAK